MTDASERTAGRRPRSARSLFRLLALGLVTFASTAAGGADRFYLEALEQGRAARAAGETRRAVERLHIACFGLLDEPSILADCVVQLALAQAAAGEREDFLVSFERVDELERRFGAYSKLPSDVRTSFEERVLDLVADDALGASTGFARLARAKERRRIAELTGARKAAELERLVRERPNDTTWRLMLVRERVAGGDGAKVLEELEILRVALPDELEVTCLRGRAYLQAGQCQMSRSEAERCDLREFPIDELARYVDCLTTADRWEEAASVLVSLSPEKRSARPLARRETRIARALPPEVEIAAIAPFEPPSATTSAGGDRGSRAPADPAAELATLRARLDAATSQEELAAVAAEAERLGRSRARGTEFLYIAGEAAYLASDWRRAAALLLASGEIPENRPALLFYLAVSLFEIGDSERAASTLLRALPMLERTPIVERYRRHILEQDS